MISDDCRELPAAGPMFAPRGVVVSVFDLHEGLDGMPPAWRAHMADVDRARAEWERRKCS